MQARVTPFQADPSRRADAERITTDLVEPSLREESGFENVHVLFDMQTGEGMVITLWSTAEAEAGEP